MSPTSPPIPSELHLEQMRHGERPWPSDPDARAAAVAAAQARAALDADVLSRLPPTTFAARVLAAAEASAHPSPHTPARRRAVWVLGPALAAVVVVVVVTPRVSPQDADVLKGDGPALLLSRASPTGSVPLRPGDVVASGDTLQIHTRGVAGWHGVIVSIDGNGHVTRHFPEPGQPTTLPRGTQPLPFSFELDDAPRFERFIFVTANAAFDPAVVERAAETVATTPDPAHAALALPPGLTATDFLLVKQ